jgi:hypothetical protein
LVRFLSRGGSASKSQPSPTIAGRPIYLRRTEANGSQLPGRGGCGRRGAGRWWGRGGLHGRERLRRGGRLRVRLAAGDGREDHVADDPPGPASAVLAAGPSRHGSVPGIRMSSLCRSFRLGREVIFGSGVGRVRLASLPAWAIDIRHGACSPGPVSNEKKNHRRNSPSDRGEGDNPPHPPPRAGLGFAADRYRPAARHRPLATGGHLVDD